MNKVKICGGVLESLPDDLRYLCWHRYPSKSLPSNVNLNHLVELDMSDSNLQHLWNGTMVRLTIMHAMFFFGCV